MFLRRPRRNFGITRPREGGPTGHADQTPSQPTRTAASAMSWQEDLKEQVPPDGPAKKPLTRLPSKTKLIKIKSNRSLRFRVRFEDTDSPTVYSYKKPSSKHLPNLYFSVREKAEIQFLARCEGETFLFEEEELVEKLEKCYATCGREDITFDDDPANAESMVAWVALGTRGLEDTVSEEFEDNRTQAVTMILEYQKYLKETLKENFDCDELLRAFSEKTSLRAREFSQRMAIADAEFAHLYLHSARVA